MNKEKLEKLAEQGDEEAKLSLAEVLSIRERLERRLKTRTIKVQFSDDLGDFDVEIRLMSPEEQRNLMKLYSDLSGYLKVQSPQKDSTEEAQKLLDRGTELLNQIYELAGYLCVDKELDANYWKQGSGFNIDVPLQIIRAAISESQKVEEQARKFRTD